MLKYKRNEALQEGGGSALAAGACAGSLMIKSPSLVTRMFDVPFPRVTNVFVLVFGYYAQRHLREALDKQYKLKTCEKMIRDYIEELYKSHDNSPLDLCALEENIYNVYK